MVSFPWPICICTSYAGFKVIGVLILFPFPYYPQAKEKLIEKQIRQNQEAEMKSLLTAQKRDYDVRKEQIKRNLGDANTPKRQREDSLRAHKESFEYSQAEEGQRYPNTIWGI